MSKLVYVACPYGHPERSVIDYRMKAFYAVDAHLTNLGMFVASPMNKIHMVETHNIHSSWSFLEEYSYELLAKCSKIIVIEIDGWKESIGVQAEITFAKKNNISVEYINPENFRRYTDERN